MEDFPIDDIEINKGTPEEVELKISKWVEEALTRRLKYEKGISLFSQCLMDDASSDEALLEALNHLRDASKADWVVLFENYLDHVGAMHSRAIMEARQKKLNSIKSFDSFAPLSYEEFKHWKEVFLNRRVISGEVGETEGEKELFEETGIKNLMAWPIWIENFWYGFLFLGSREKGQAFSDEDAFLLNTSSKVLSMFLARREENKNRQKLIEHLMDAAEQIHALRELIPICAKCKKIRDDAGYWHQVEDYFHSYVHANFTHGLCPICMEEFIKEFEKKKDSCEHHCEESPSSSEGS